MNRIFSQESFLWRALNVLTDIFALSALWLLCSAPIITIGASTIALYDCVVHGIRRKEEGIYKRFFRSFKNGLKIGIFSALLWGAVLGLGFFMLSFLRNEGAVAAAAAYYVVLLIPIGCVCWIFPIFSRFSMSFKELNIAALKFSVGYIPRTLVIALLTVEAGSFCIKYIFPVFFMPAVLMLLWSLFIEPVFKKFEGGSEPDNL